jgi:hypothetical protein
MKTRTSMTLIGLAAIGADYAFVASIFALLLLSRHDGAGIVLDVLFAVLIAEAILLVRYGGILHQFMSRLQRDDFCAASRPEHCDRH